MEDCIKYFNPSIPRFLNLVLEKKKKIDLEDIKYIFKGDYTDRDIIESLCDYINSFKATEDGASVKKIMKLETALKLTENNKQILAKRYSETLEELTKVMKNINLKDKEITDLQIEKAKNEAQIGQLQRELYYVNLYKDKTITLFNEDTKE